MTHPHHTAPFWASDDQLSAGVSGELVEEALRVSLVHNPFSLKGFTLSAAQALQRRRRQQQHLQRRAAGGQRRGREPTATPTEETAAPTEGKESLAAQAILAEEAELLQSVAGLVRATGAPFSAPPKHASEAALASQTTDETLTSSTVPTVDDATVVQEPPQKHPRMEEGQPGTGTASSVDVESSSLAPVAVAPRVSGPPKSALAQLVASAKAKHGVSGDDGKMPPPPPRPRPSDSGVTKEAGGEARRGKGTSTALKEGAVEKDEEDDDEFGVALGLVTGAPSLSDSASGASRAGGPTDASNSDDLAMKHPSQMTREEFLSQFKRAPRRGEIGQTAEEIAVAEQLGYVMSGSRSKASQMYVDRIQRQLHEREAAKLQKQFRKVEDERMDELMVEGMLKLVQAKKSDS